MLNQVLMQNHHVISCIFSCLCTSPTSVWKDEKMSFYVWLNCRPAQGLLFQDVNGIEDIARLEINFLKSILAKMNHCSLKFRSKSDPNMLIIS